MYLLFHLVSARLSLISILSFASVLYPRNLSMGSIICHLVFVVYPSTLSTTLSHLIPLAFLLLSPTQPYQLWTASPFLACSLLYIAISTTCFKWVHSQSSALNAVLYPRNLSMGSIICHLVFVVYPSTLSRLRYPTLFQLALLLLSPTQPYQLWKASPFLACSSLYIAISTTCFKWVHSQSSALNAVLLVVLGHPSTF